MTFVFIKNEFLHRCILRRLRKYQNIFTTFYYCVGNKAKSWIKKGCFKKTKLVKFFEKQTFFTSWYAHTIVETTFIPTQFSILVLELLVLLRENLKWTWFLNKFIFLNCNIIFAAFSHFWVASNYLSIFYSIIAF